MSTLQERLIEVSQGLPRGWKAELARACGIKPPSISDWLTGKTKSLEGSNLLVAANYFGVTAKWLSSGDPPKFKEESKPKNEVSQETTDLVVIPQFDTGGSMGDGLVLRDQPGVIKGWSVNHEWINKNIKNHSGAKNLCIVTGFGDSMKGMFNSGDPLVVDMGIKSVDYDAVYFFRVGDEGFIKRLQRIPGQGIVAISENKSYRDWVIESHMDFEVFGRVLKAWNGEDY